jgi:hypothetical protein
MKRVLFLVREEFDDMELLYMFYMVIEGGLGQFGRGKHQGLGET